MQVGIKLTQALKNKSNLVIWGGVLPTLNPEEALQYANAVCIGEGEDAMLELVRKMNSSQDFNSIPNIWFKGKSRPEKNILQIFLFFLCLTMALKGISFTPKKNRGSFRLKPVMKMNIRTIYLKNMSYLV